jgi:hypothetical protein
MGIVFAGALASTAAAVRIPAAAAMPSTARLSILIVSSLFDSWR